MTPKEFPKSEEPASELIANAEQILRGAQRRYTMDGEDIGRYEIAPEGWGAVVELLVEARARVAAAEQDTHRLREAASLKRNVLIWGGEIPHKFVGEWVAVPREDFDVLRAALGAIPQEEPQK